MTENCKNNSEEKLEFVGTSIPQSIKQKLQIHLIMERKDLRTWLIEQILKLDDNKKG